MRTCRIKVKELSTLFDAVVAAGAHPHIGHQSVDQTENSIKHLLNQELVVSTDVILSALWSAKMLEELGQLKSLTQLSFKDLLSKTLPNVDDFYFWEKKHK